MGVGMSLVAVFLTGVFFGVLFLTRDTLCEQLC